jgi:predicted phage replisome organizer
MKLYLRSLQNGGKLMFNNMIPYTPTILAQVVRHQVGTVEKALQIFQKLGLIEILENGAIYMMDIQNFIGESSTEADRKREYRTRINQEKSMLLEEKGQMSRQTSDKSTPEIDIDIDIDK